MNKRYIVSRTAIFLILLSGCTPPPNSPPTSIPTLDEVGEVEVLVYFTNTTRYAQGIQPFESAVLRRLPASAFSPQAVLEEYFRGPTQSEQELDLQAITSGFTGIGSVELVDGYAHVYLEGTCQSSGATYTIAQPILRNLAQFPEIEVVKIYDENGDTSDPKGKGHSIPICLEP
jgi:hypothetical protein